MLSEDLPMPQSDSWKNNVNRFIENNDIGRTVFDSFYLSKTKEGESPTEDNTGMILVRALLADLDGNRSKESKYVFLQSFYGEGDLSTIDIVKLPEGYHKDIIDTYLDNILTPDISLDLMPRDKGETSRFFAAGGHVETDNEMIEFTDHSQDYGNNISTYCSNDIAAYLVFQSSLSEPVSMGNNIINGGKFINKNLDMMINHKKTPEFYNQLIDMHILEKIRNGIEVTRVDTGAIAMTKAYDRSITYGVDPIQAIVEEHSGGIGRDILLLSTVENMKLKNK